MALQALRPLFALPLSLSAQSVRDRPQSDQGKWPITLRYVGQTRQPQSVRASDIQRFKAWLQDLRRAGKTQELTITAVRTFFVLLVDIDVLPTSPAEDVYPPAAASPPPEVLYDSEADTFRATVAQMATRAEDPDRVPALLAHFFLDQGLRAGEVVRLTTQDIDLSNPLRPVVHIRYAHR